MGTDKEKYKCKCNQIGLTPFLFVMNLDDDQIADELKNV